MCVNTCVYLYLYEDRGVWWQCERTGVWGQGCVRTGMCEDKGVLGKGCMRTGVFEDRGVWGQGFVNIIWVEHSRKSILSESLVMESDKTVLLWWPCGCQLAFRFNFNFDCGWDCLWQKEQQLWVLGAAGLGWMGGLHAGGASTTKPAQGEEED